MAITPKLEIKQSQSLQLTPQLRQAIELLQMNNLELNEFVEQELQTNPLLERENDRLADAPDDFIPTIDDYETSSLNNLEVIETDAPDTDLQNEFDDSISDTQGCAGFENTDWADYNQSKNYHDYDDDFDFFEQKLSASKSLYTIIEEQISLHFTRASDKIIAKILSRQLDAAGYFRGSIETLASQLKTSPERIRTILQTCKTFEPSGIFAENLADCLQIQLNDQNLLSAQLKTLLQNLPLLAERKFKELTKLCNCTTEELTSYIALIRSQNPKPAADYDILNISYIIPDVYVKQNSNGSYRVELNQMTLPKLLINRSYYSELQADRSTARYLKTNLQRANFLTKALHQRATAILRISEEIVLRQYQFFEKGIEYLKPLTLKDVAGALEISESTVSRVTSGKYMSTPRGLFELKYFFSAAAGSYTGDEDTSTTTIKHKIKQLINNELPSAILSDDKIVELLGQEGICIARRTVAKYRDQMGIPTSAERKRTKR